MQKPNITIFTGPQGHYSIAKALEQTLKSKYNVKIFYERDFLFTFYTPLYQLLPQASGVPFFLSQKLAHNKKTVDLALDLFRFKYNNKLEKFVSKYRPVAYFSTYFMFNATLEHFQSVGNKPFINCFTDPRTIHRLLVSDKAKLNIAFDRQTVKDAKQMSPQAQVKAMGWLVRDEFEQDYDMNQVREKLKLKPDIFTILISSGSEGTNMILKILPSVLLAKTPIQVIVACGNNKTLFRAVNGLQRFAQKRKQYQANLIPIGFTKEIYRYLQASDLVLGKAGPNTIFEAVATKTPFFAITHIAGQEDGNLDIIRKYNLGYVEENPLKATKLLNKIIKDPGLLKSFAKPLAKMAEYNHQTKTKLMENLETLLNAA